MPEYSIEGKESTASDKPRELGPQSTNSKKLVKTVDQATTDQNNESCATTWILGIVLFILIVVLIVLWFNKVPENNGNDDALYCYGANGDNMSQVKEFGGIRVRSKTLFASSKKPKMAKDTMSFKMPVAYQKYEDKEKPSFTPPKGMGPMASEGCPPCPVTEPCAMAKPPPCPSCPSCPLPEPCPTATPTPCPSCPSCPTPSPCPACPVSVEQAWINQCKERPDCRTQLNQVMRAFM